MVYDFAVALFKLFNRNVTVKHVDKIKTKGVVRMKKLLSEIVIMAVLVPTLLTGCGTSKDAGKEEAPKGSTEKTIEFPLKEKVTVTMSGRRKDVYAPHADVKLLKDLEAKTNIHVEWIDWPESTWNEKKNLAFASGDYPEALFGGFVLSTSDIVNYGSQGLLTPIENNINSTIMPNFSKVLEKRPGWKKEITTADGHIYGLPSVNEPDMNLTNDALLINKVWLDKVGKSIPKTTDEFYEVLKAFKAAKDLNGNGKDDEIPFTFRYGDNIYGMASLVGSFGLVDPKSHFNVVGGKAVFVPAQSEYKEGIKYINKLYSEGLLDKECFTMNSPAMSAKIKAKTPIVGACIAWSEDTVHAESGLPEGTYIAIPPLKGPKGEPVWQARVSPVNSNFGFVVTNKAKKPEILLKWADLFYDKDMSIQAFNGFYDKYIRKKSDNKFEELMAPDGKPYKSEVKSADVPTNFGLYAILKEDYQLEIPKRSAASKNKVDQLYKPFLEKTPYNDYLFMTKQETERAVVLSTDINDYVMKTAGKWISDGKIDQEWDAYLKKLKEIGLDEYVKIKQAPYDRSK